MGNEDIAAAAFRDGLHGNPISDLATVRDLSTRSSPHNWATLAAAGRAHARDMPWSDFGDLAVTTSSEFGSPLYDFTWSLCTYASAESTRAQQAYTSMLAYAALCLCPVESFELHDLRGVHRRQRDEFDAEPDRSMAHYRGPISISPGNRYLWDTSQVPLHVERSLIGTLAALALGQTWRWDGWNHATHGWAMEAAFPGPTPRDEQHGLTVDLPSSVEDLVAIVNRLPMRSNQRVDLLLLSGGRKLAVLSSSTGPNTRGPALVTEFDGNKTMRIHSPARQTGGGQWTNCKAELDGNRWATWQSGNESQRLEGTVPGDIEHHIVWNPSGCRIVGQEPPVSETLPTPVAETTRGLLEFDAAGRKVAGQGTTVRGPERDDVSDSFAELMKRCMQGSRESAADGTVNTLAKMEALGWTTPAVIAKLKRLVDTW